PHLVALNPRLAAELGLDPATLAGPAGVQALTGNAVPEGARPLASVYSGHQFGVWAGQLGDGRAILLGEADTAAGPQEFQLKGSGRTPYSRMGDGRAVLRSSIREFLGSEAMHGLGIPTTRALMLTGSPAPVIREEVESAAVVTRVAPSFIRFGHFEHFASRGQEAELRTLADFVIDRFYPGCREGDTLGGNPYARLLAQVSERTAALVAQWQAVGFCHGVMNTDNMSILGLTIDYGPFQFMDAFDPRHICNHSDTQGRYAFARQPDVAYWNLFCLAQALMTLIGEEEIALAALETYKNAFPQALQARLRAKLGLEGEAEGDVALMEGLFQQLAQDHVDHTIFWRRLSAHVAGGPVDPVRDLFLDRAGFDAWWRDFAGRLPADRAEAGARMLRTNPKFVLRNHVGELAIREARAGDFTRIQVLLDILHAPFDEHPGHDELAGFPPDWAQQIEISCSS
ncbi:YdiU family protein, partial [Ramlibacter aquaticus]